MVQNVLCAVSQSKFSQLWGRRGLNASFEMRLCVFKAERNIKLVLLLVVFWNPAGSAGGRPKSAPQAVRGAKKIFRVNVRQHLQDVFVGEGLACVSIQMFPADAKKLWLNLCGREKEPVRGSGGNAAERGSTQRFHRGLP